MSYLLVYIILITFFTDRMVEPSAGKIILDGIDLLSLPLSILRNSIAIVPQVLSLCHYPIMSTGSDIESLIFDP